MQLLSAALPIGPNYRTEWCRPSVLFASIFQNERAYINFKFGGNIFTSVIGTQFSGRKVKVKVKVTGHIKCPVDAEYRGAFQHVAADSAAILQVRTFSVF